MKTISLKTVPEKSPREMISEYIESIPDGEAVLFKDAIADLGVGSLTLWETMTKDIRFVRYVGNRERSILVNAKTAKSLRDAGQK